MRIPMYLPYRRVGKIMEPAPTPVRRNRRDVLNMHLIYASIKTRPEKELVERVEGGLISMNSSKFRSPEQRKQTQMIRRIYDERVNLDFR
jgi:ribosomal protein S7